MRQSCWVTELPMLGSNLVSSWLSFPECWLQVCITKPGFLFLLYSATLLKVSNIFKSFLLILSIFCCSEEIWCKRTSHPQAGGILKLVKVEREHSGWLPGLVCHFTLCFGNQLWTPFCWLTHCMLSPVGPRCCHYVT